MSETTPHHVIFLRHGESVGNAQDRFQGQADFPLTERGQDQARALAARWQAEGMTFDRCISSPLLRARQTAETVCAALDVPLEFDPGWMEINNGKLAGLTHDEGQQVAPRPAFMTPYHRYGETGESRWEVYLRAGQNVQRLVDAPPARILVVSHGGILNMAMYAMLNVPVQADFTGPRFLFHNIGFATLEYRPEHHNWYLLGFDGGVPEEEKMD
jgi:2,3-bisphosphoglycerate-dependent phosphoglycerate mutase